jgi:dihydrofolate reductase
MTVYTGASMSLDGFIAGPDDTGFEHLFAWMDNGDVKLETADPEMTLSMTQDNYDHFQRMLETGAIVVGRHLYDLTNGWGGQHPMGCPVVVLTHNPPEEPPGPDFHFVSTGVEDAVAKAVELAGDKPVGVNAGDIAQQCLDAGLLDEIWVDLAPVFLGSGKRFFTGTLESPLVLDGPETFPGTGVSHLRYRVRK